MPNTYAQIISGLIYYLKPCRKIRNWVNLLVSSLGLQFSLRQIQYMNRQWDCEDTNFQMFQLLGLFNRLSIQNGDYSINQTSNGKLRTAN